MLLSMLSQDSRALGSWKSPKRELGLHKKSGADLTFCKMRNKAVCRLVDKVELPGDTDCSQNVITSAHDFPNASFRKFSQHTSCSRLQLVFENDESNKIKPRLSLLALHL